LVFSIKKFTKETNPLLKITLVLSIIYSFVAVFSYVNIILTDEDFYISYPFETILLLIGSLFLIYGNFLILLLKKSAFFLSLIGVVILISINSSFEVISFWKYFYGVEFQLLIFILMKVRISGISTWEIIYRNKNLEATN
tara:strand:+ start:242 stop:661 length:420 start_codon:yes stop_codon:yes gene_type:complete